MQVYKRIYADGENYSEIKLTKGETARKIQFIFLQSIENNTVKAYLKDEEENVTVVDALEVSSNTATFNFASKKQGVYKVILKVEKGEEIFYAKEFTLNIVTNFVTEFQGESSAADDTGAIKFITTASGSYMKFNENKLLFYDDYSSQYLEVNLNTWTVSYVSRRGYDTSEFSDSLNLSNFRYGVPEKYKGTYEGVTVRGYDNRRAACLKISDKLSILIQDVGGKYAVFRVL